MNNFIQIININKSFDNLKKTKVLKKISYKFKKGKVYSLIGPSGSGKSTLLNLLSLIDRPTSGSMRIENNQIDFNDTKKSLPVGMASGKWGALASYGTRFGKNTKRQYGTSGNSFVAVVEFVGFVQPFVAFVVTFGILVGIPIVPVLVPSMIYAP